MRIYFCPALLSWLNALVSFAVLYNAGERNVSTFLCAWLGGAFTMGYMLTSLAAGFIINHRNARILLLSSAVCAALLSVYCIFTKAYFPLLTGFVGLSIVIAIFLNSFQMFMRNETIPGGLAWSVGVYTLACGAGSSFGILLAGVVYRFGPLAFSAIAMLVVGIILTVLLTYVPQKHRDGGREIEETMQGGRQPIPIYILIGWLLIFTAMFVQRPLHVFFPKISAENGISASLTGLPLFLNLLIQGIVGLLMSKLPGALYRRMPLLIIQLAGAVFCGFILLRPTSFVFTFIGVSLLGICSGASCFLSVYFCNNSGNRSMNIGMNEFLGGLGSLAGLFAAEWRMDAIGSQHALYQVFVVAMIVSVLIQVTLATIGQRHYAAKTV
jgi:MFS family permease